MPAPYPDFRWFVRTVRVLPVVAVAALAGGLIGGFSVFAVDLALTAPPSRDAGSEGGKINAEKATESGAAAAPAAGTSAPPVPAQTAPNGTAQTGGIAGSQPMPQTAAQTAPQISVTPPPSPQQTSWPDALSRDHKPVTDTAASTPPPAMSQPGAAPEQAPATQAARDRAGASEQMAKTEDARSPVPVKRRAALKRTAAPAANGNVAEEAASPNGQRVYDYYGRAAASTPDARARYDRPRDDSQDWRMSVRHQPADREDRSVDADSGRSEADGDAMPPQPAPPPLLFGLFGGGDRSDDQ
jgi:hypothetical protein